MSLVINCFLLEQCTVLAGQARADKYFMFPLRISELEDQLQSKAEAERQLERQRKVQILN